MSEITIDNCLKGIFDTSPEKIEFEYTLEDEKSARKELRKILKRCEKRKLEETEVNKSKKVKLICDLDFDDKNLSDNISKIKTQKVLVTESCIHEVALPPDQEYISLTQMGGKPAKKYSFELDSFQKQAIQCIENDQSVLVSAHTSAGKTVVAEYAIAMCLKNNQRVIYTTPIKALSNQKYCDFTQEFEDVGLLTGDTTINESASCLVMTTEVLRAMLYEGAEITREIGWVIFDEIHYMRDKERGYVWEESIVLLSPTVKVVFLSATIPNARQFAEWICFIRNQPCHVVYTETRPTPLEHYVFPANTGDIYMIVDDKGNFKESNFNTALASLQKGSETANIATAKGEARLNAAFDCFKLVKTIMSNSFTPAIVFSFSKKACERYAKQALKLTFTVKKEQDTINEVINNALEVISKENRNLACVQSYLPYLKKGIGIHHGGLLPIIKELTELLFGEGLVKVLFATETFAMGLNMPAKTVLFTSLQKFDGKTFRSITPGEYIQMSGRAGRRGKDDRGIVIMKLDNDINTVIVKNLLKGKADPIKSAFHLTYNMVLNTLRFEGTNPESILKRSFFQFQNYAKLPNIMKEIKCCAKARKLIKVKHTDAVDRYYKLSEKLKALYVERHKYVIQCKRFVGRLSAGRLVKVIHHGIRFGWCVVLDHKDVSDFGLSKKLRILVKVSEESIVDSEDYDFKVKSLRPPKSASSPGFPVVAVMPHTSVWELSTRRLQLPEINSLQSKKIAIREVDECIAKYFNDKFIVDPIEDLFIRDKEFLIIMDGIEKTRKILQRSPIHNKPNRDQLMEKAKLRADNKLKNDHLVEQFEETKGVTQLNELKHRKRVLRRLGFLTVNDVITTKGSVACDLSAANELLLIELLFNGQFNDLNPSECCALLSAFVCTDKADKPPRLKPKLENALVQLRATAERVANVIWFCKLIDDVQSYTEQFQPSLIEVIYYWCLGRPFAHVCKKTTIYPGNIITSMRRLLVLLRQMVKAATTIGATDQEKKFQCAITLLKRDIVGVDSLYRFQ